MYICDDKVNIKYETSFSRLRTQGPQTPGKLHEPSCSNTEARTVKLHTPVLFPNKGE